MARTFKSGQPKKESKQLWEAMGLSKHEWEEVHEFVHELIATDKPVSECISMIKDEFTTEEEIFTATYIFGVENGMKHGISGVAIVG